LDILRAFAILFVVYGHGRNLLGNYYVKLYELPVLDGVSIFFVLSGFLIGGVLLRIINETNFNRNDLFQFWIRRWFRTLPNYYLVLSILVVIAYISYHAQGIPFPRILYKYFVFIQNFYTPHPGFFNEAWSLAIEEWFYLLIPLFLFLTWNFTRLDKKQTILFWIITIIAGVTLYRTWAAIHLQVSTIEAWDLYLRKQTVTRLDSIMFGFLGAYLAYYKHDIWIKYKDILFWGGMFLLAGQKIYTYLYDTDVYYLSYFSFTVTSLATLMLLPKLNMLQSGQGIFYRFFTFISIISYSMYLLHLSLVQKLLLPYLLNSLGITAADKIAVVVAQYVSYWTLTIILSGLLYLYYEKPTTKLREAFSGKPIKNIITTSYQN
jgi:peptidoglycan/LPS O-acetylase OafA/YrhL